MPAAGLISVMSISELGANQLELRPTIGGQSGQAPGPKPDERTVLSSTPQGFRLHNKNLCEFTEPLLLSKKLHDNH
jgi:hypothetical protein